MALCPFHFRQRHFEQAILEFGLGFFHIDFRRQRQGARECATHGLRAVVIAFFFFLFLFGGALDRYACLCQRYLDILLVHAWQFRTNKHFVFAVDDVYLGHAPFKRCRQFAKCRPALAPGAQPPAR